VIYITPTAISLTQPVLRHSYPAFVQRVGSRTRCLVIYESWSSGHRVSASDGKTYRATRVSDFDSAPVFQYREIDLVH